jgi:hypothetical protein
LRLVRGGVKRVLGGVEGGADIEPSARVVILSTDCRRPFVD